MNYISQKERNIMASEREIKESKLKIKEEFTKRISMHEPISYYLASEALRLFGDGAFRRALADNNYVDCLWSGGFTVATKFNPEIIISEIPNLFPRDGIYSTMTDGFGMASLKSLVEAHRWYRQILSAFLEANPDYESGNAFSLTDEVANVICGALKK